MELQLVCDSRDHGDPHRLPRPVSDSDMTLTRRNQMLRD